MSHSNQVQVCFAQLAQQTRKKEKSMSRALTRSEIYDQNKKVPSVTAAPPPYRPSPDTAKRIETDTCAIESAPAHAVGRIVSASSSDKRDDGSPTNAQDILNQITERMNQLDEAVSRLYACSHPFMKDSAVGGYRLQYLDSDENSSSLETLLTSIANRVSTAHNDITSVCERLTFVNGK